MPWVGRASGLDDPGDGLGGFGDHVAGLVLVAGGGCVGDAVADVFVEQADRDVLKEVTSADLGYGDPRGNARLREVLCGWLATTRGVRTDPDGIIVVAGQRAIAVEDPGSRGARDELAHWGLQPVPVPVDDHGLDVEELGRTGLGTVLLTPAHQFPTGVVLSPPRRRALLAWARDGGLVIEDDYDAEHRYDRMPVRALQPAAPDHVAHTGSTSKTLAPGMRLGWLVPPADLQRSAAASPARGVPVGDPTCSRWPH
jgi:GntR family transcriptional regulator / MocR family aminotransferase